jgi:DNA-3-methyladenine glycosylase
VRLKRNFYTSSALEVAPDLLGKLLVRKFSTKTVKYKITETEVYCGEEDLACHASKGKTSRTKVMYEKGGVVYVYLVYGMYWMLNIVTGKKDYPEAVLIRSLEGFDGPGKVGKELKIAKSFYGEDLTKSKRLWIEEPGVKKKITSKKAKRVGVDYAGKWANKPWRFILSKP